MISIRTLIFTSLIFLFSVLALSFSTISLNFLGIDFDRGDSESILGLSLGLDLKGGTHLVYEAVPNKDREITNEDMEGARKILERRVNSFGISESSVQIVGSGSGVSKKLLVQLPGLSDLNINLTIAGGVNAEDLENSLNDFGFEDIKVTEIEALDGRFLLSGPKLNNDDNGGLNNLLNSLDKKYPASFLIAYSSQSEDGEQLDVPEIDKVIESANIIDSDNSVEDLSQGIYRVTMKNFLPVSEEKAVALSGEDLVDAFPDVQPGIARPVVTIIFDDDGADEFYDLTSRVAKNQDLLAIFLDGEQLIAPSASSGISGGRAFIQGPTFDQQSVKTISIQLKSGALPVGAAAVILSIGVAVDANILISERTKEELRSGRNIFASISEGFSRAWPSIRDSNVSTIIICVVLYWFGDRFTTSVIQGFALTLGIGVLLSMFTAFTVSRLLMRLISSTPIGEKDNLYDPLGSRKVGDND